MACTTPLESTFRHTSFTSVHVVYAQVLFLFCIGNFPMISPQLVMYKGFWKFSFLNFRYG